MSRSSARKQGAENALRGGAPGPAAGRPVTGVRREHVRRSPRWYQTVIELWNLYTYSPQVAELALPPLLDHKSPDIRAGALCGLIEIHKVGRWLERFRAASRADESIVRDAGVWGLSQSCFAKDEVTLWEAPWDPIREIRLSAAYSLRVMPREIDDQRYRKALDQHEDLLVKLELAERAVSDRRLRAAARESMRRLGPALKSAGLLTAQTRRLLVQLGVSRAVTSKHM